MHGCRLLLLLLVFSQTTLAQTDSLETFVDSLMSDFDQEQTPGASVGIYQDGEIILAKAYGNARLYPSEKASPATNYRLASLTKQFTAMSILMLAHQDKLALDDPITDYFDGFPNYGQQIEIQHLVHHTSGLIDYEDLIPNNQSEQLSDQDVLDLLKKQTRTYFPPGSQYRYSNTGYAFLALIVEQISGLSFPTFLQQNIFEPLGMRETVAYEEGVSTVLHRAYGYTWDGYSFRETDQSITSAVLGDGGIYTSALEYFLWDQALYSDHLLPAEVLRKAFEPGRLNNGRPINYGFGWMIDSYRGKHLVRHTGGTIGFRSVVDRYPDEKFTVFIIANRAAAKPWEIAKQIADFVLF